MSRKNRVYSRALKQQAVQDYLSGKGSLRSICKKYGILNKKSGCNDYRAGWYYYTGKEIFLEDLPMRWIVSSATGAEVCSVYCAVPYYPDFTYHIRGGYYANITVNSIILIGIFDDITAFDTTQPCIVGMSGNISNINAYRLDTEFGRTTQYDTSVNAGKDKIYASTASRPPRRWPSGRPRPGPSSGSLTHTATVI